ncbi:MAG: DUF3429 domain-containing protein [Pseudomonadota bacterium]
MIASIRVYGYFGLIPFIASVLGYYLYPLYSGVMLGFFMLYSSIILAFLAGSLWAFELAVNRHKEKGGKPFRVGLSVAIAFSLLPILAYGASLWSLHIAVIVQMTAFVLLFVWEGRHIQEEVMPTGYRSLRAVLTVVVTLCHGALLFGL